MQVSLFDEPGPARDLPPGLRYQADLIDAGEEASLIRHFETLEFKPFAFQGWEGKRETVSFGWRYDFNESRVSPAPPIPAFLLPLREHAAAFAGIAVSALEQALVVRYDVGAGIGWHRDRPVFQDVIGVSLLAPCVMRFRRRDGRAFRRFGLPLEPRSAYLLSGEARHEWEHSIVPMIAPRFSVTFRSRTREG